MGGSGRTDPRDTTGTRSWEPCACHPTTGKTTSYVTTAVETRNRPVLGRNLWFEMGQKPHGHLRLSRGRKGLSSSQDSDTWLHQHSQWESRIWRVVGQHSPPCILLLSRIVHEFIRQFNLHVTPFREDNNTWYAVNHVRKRMEEVNENPDVLNYPVDPSEEGKSATQLYREALNKVCAHRGGLWPCTS